MLLISNHNISSYGEIRKLIPELSPNTVEFCFKDHLWDSLKVILLAKATHICSAKALIYAIFNDESFNDTLTNDIVSFEKLGPGLNFKLY